jgi:hypothetical protein
MQSTIDLLIAPYGKKNDLANLPNATQQKILEWVDKWRNTPIKDFDHIPVLYVQGGNGSGKTRGITAPVIEMLTQINSIRILWGRYDFKDLKLSVIDKFFEIMPVELIVDKNEQYHYYDIMQPEQGVGRIYFNGLKDLKGLGSQEFAVIVVTEAHELTEAIYRALKRRCRQADMPCMIMMESEPPNATHWLAEVTDPAKDNYDPDIEKMEVSTYENWDNLPTAYRGSLESMPASAKRKYIDGKTGFSITGKPYYSGYNDNLHSGEFDWMDTKELILGWDFGFHFPACIVTQIDNQDRWVWLREFIGRDITIDKFGDFIVEQISLHYPNAKLRHYGDPACNQVNDKSEHTSWQILHSKGINIITKQSTYRERKEIIEGKLAKLIGDKPSMLLDKRFCKVAIDGFQGGYHYPIHKEEQMYEDRFELPFKDGFYEHIMNAGEYIAVNLFKAFKPTGTRTKHPNGAV